MSLMAEAVTRSSFAHEPPPPPRSARRVSIIPTSTNAPHFSTPPPPSNLAASTSATADAMDVSSSSPPSAIGPASDLNSPQRRENDSKGLSNGIKSGSPSSAIKPSANDGTATSTTNGTNGATLSAAAAAGGQQPKVVQTAFIHKLYNMLEDQGIRHLISWSNTNESFVMSPSSEFSKVLAQYFKHTNISSFVRQLNMYGFHKVSDVFHTGAPESALWEFKHGNGSFKRGDLAGLREIKRRASRHTLIHRDSFSSPHKPSIISASPNTPADTAAAAAAAPAAATAGSADTGDARLAHIEHSLYEMHNRLMRAEESNNSLNTKCASLTDHLARSQQWNNDLAQILLRLIPDQDNPLYKDLSAMQKEMARQAEATRALDDPHETLLSGRQPYFANMAIEAGPISPRQMPAEDQRRPSLPGIYHPRATSFFRPPPPPQLALSPRRYGSVSGPSLNHSPSYARTAATNAALASSQIPTPTPPPPQHPLASVTEAGYNLARRHTSADIRDTPGWPPQPPGSGNSPFESSPTGGPSTAGAGPPASPWPPSPRARSPNPAERDLRDQLASYEFGSRRPTATAATLPPPLLSRASPPPGPFSGSGMDPPPFGSSFGGADGRDSSGSNNHNNNGSSAGGVGGSGWTFGGGGNNNNNSSNANANANAKGFASRLMDSAPVTRRSSMASNVHNLLNPAETAERDDEDAQIEDRKRKRLQ